jgi:thiamine pyrophosphate-dependent acetolactate synthase large subunit-like protein
MLRALTFANSEPKGPVYLYAGREAMEEHLDPSSSTAKLSALRSPGGLDEWSPMERSALSPFAILKIGAALLNAKRPLIITSYAGRHPEAVNALVKLSETISIPIYLSCPSVVNVPFSCKNLVGLGYGMGKNEWLEEADCVLVIDSDVPWIPLHTRPKDDCQVYHIDVDPLKQNVNVFQCVQTFFLLILRFPHLLWLM